MTRDTIIGIAYAMSLVERGKTMRVALTAWEDRISPVFDSARTLLIAEIKKKKIISRLHIFFNPEKTSSLAEALNKLNIEILICGAISELPSNIIIGSGITLIPFISGNVEQVLEAYANGIQIVPGFLMPGCGRRHGQTRERRNVISKQQKEVSSIPKGDKTGPQGKCDGTGSGRGGCKPRKGGRGSRQGVGEAMEKGQKGRQGRGNNN
jgi:predicted Fe-Mo cluster-binding NifX family protein